MDLVGKQAGDVWVYPRVDVEGETYRVALAINLGVFDERGAEPPRFDAAQVDAALLQADERPLEQVDRPEGNLAAYGGPSAYVPADFRFQKSGEAETLRVTVRNDTVDFSLATDQIRPKEDEDEGPPGYKFHPLFSKLLEIVDLILQAIHKVLERFGIGRRGRKCCVRSFRVPANRTGCQNANHARESFDMLATFTPRGSCDCGCCEYRQYVRGFFQLNGADRVHPLPTGNLSRTVWREDGVPNGYGGGVDFFYGRRALPGTGTDVYRNPNRADGCTYEGFDRPGWSNLDPGDTARAFLEFRATIIDTCRGNRVKRTAAWTVDCSFPPP